MSKSRELKPFWVPLTVSLFSVKLKATSAAVWFTRNADTRQHTTATWANVGTSDCSSL